MSTKLKNFAHIFMQHMTEYGHRRAQRELIMLGYTFEKLEKNSE